LNRRGAVDRLDAVAPVPLRALDRGFGDVIDPEKLLDIAETAVERAKRNGRNRVETVDGAPSIQVRLPNS